MLNYYLKMNNYCIIKMQYFKNISKYKRKLSQTCYITTGDARWGLWVQSVCAKPGGDGWGKRNDQQFAEVRTRAAAGFWGYLYSQDHRAAGNRSDGHPVPQHGPFSPSQLSAWPTEGNICNYRFWVITSRTLSLKN